MRETSSLSADPLFAPYTVRGHTLRNRVVMAPMATLRGITTSRGVRWYGEHAEGGVGLVIVESTPVARFLDSCANEAARLTAANLRPLVDAIHAGGALCVLQLYPETPALPPGANANTVPAEALRELPAAYATAAQVCAEAGFDGVEPHGAHGYLLNVLASTQTNTRADEYGVPGRLTCDVLRAVRAALPDAALVLYRHSVAGGAHLGPDADCDPAAAEETAKLSFQLRDAGVNVLDVSPGGCSQHVGKITAMIRAAPGGSALPLISVGGMDNPVAARTALRSGCCDLVAIGRGLVADPDWCNKVRDGREDTIIRCIRCNMWCMNNLQQHQPISCLRWDSATML